jgi:hypothetical protein
MLHAAAGNALMAYGLAEAILEERDAELNTAESIAP